MEHAHFSAARAWLLKGGMGIKILSKRKKEFKGYYTPKVQQQ